MTEVTTNTVSLDSITNAPVAPSSNGGVLPRDIDPFTGMRDERLDQHLGRIGKHIGGGPEKAGNIAFVVIIIALVLLIIGAGVSAYAQSDKIAAVYDRVLTGAFSIITGALGFLFGQSGTSKD